MCWPIALRMWLTGTTSSPAAGGASGPGAAAAAGGAAGAGRPGGGGRRDLRGGGSGRRRSGRCRCGAARRDHGHHVLLRDRPPVPDPSIVERSRPCSSASDGRGDRIRERGPRSGSRPGGRGSARRARRGSLRCRGLHRRHLRGRSLADRLGALIARSGRGRRLGGLLTRRRRGTAASSCAGAAPPAAPSSLTSARSVPTGTVCPSSTRIFATVPLTGEDLGVDLVGGDLEQRLVAFDGPRLRASATSGPFPRRSSRRAGASGSWSSRISLHQAELLHRP